MDQHTRDMQDLTQRNITSTPNARRWPRSSTRRRRNSSGSSRTFNSGGPKPMRGGQYYSVRILRISSCAASPAALRVEFGMDAKKLTRLRAELAAYLDDLMPDRLGNKRRRLWAEVYVRA